ncbi:transposase [Rhizobium tibeticum]|nr:transposase [Rhizobium tibeticum]
MALFWLSDEAWAAITIYNRFNRWSRRGVWLKLLAGWSMPAR